MLLNTLDFILKSRQLNIKQLSEHCDIYYDTLIKLVNNKNLIPSGYNLDSLCRELQTSSNTIIFYINVSKKPEFLGKSEQEQNFILDTIRYFVVLEGDYLVRQHNDLILPFDIESYKNITDDEGKRYYCLENIFLGKEYFYIPNLLNMNIPIELAQPVIDKYEQEMKEMYPYTAELEDVKMRINSDYSLEFYGEDDDY